MLSATQLRVGMTILFNGELLRVAFVQHITPGNWRGMVQTKLKNIKTGSTTEYRFRSEDKVEKALLETHEMEYLYESDSQYHFMNTETYEQITLNEETIGENVYFLLPNIKFMVEFYENKPIGVEPPKVVELKVVDTPPHLKGSTQSASQKPAKLETGLTIGVPPFIETGDTIRVDTGEKKYLERA